MQPYRAMNRGNTARAMRDSVSMTASGAAGGGGIVYGPATAEDAVRVGGMRVTGGGTGAAVRAGGIRLTGAGVAARFGNAGAGMLVPRAFGMHLAPRFRPVR